MLDHKGLRLFVVLVLLGLGACNNGGGSGDSDCNEGGCEIAAPDAEAGDFFGGAVAVENDTIVVGAAGDDESGFLSGSVYVYRYAGEDTEQTQKLVANDAAAGDLFGSAVAVAGDVIVVGSQQHQASGGSRSGAVYVFRRTGDAFVQEQKIEAADGSEDDFFGTSVAVSNDAIVVGAVGDDTATGSGSAYVYRFDGMTWNEEQKLAGTSATLGFGRAVAIDADRLVVGDHGARTAGDTPGNSGSAYVFNLQTGTWVAEPRLAARNGDQGDRFGRSVAIDDDTIVVGARSRNDMGPSSGNVYVYDGTRGSASHGCAIQSGTGNVVCWGNNSHGQATPPDAVNGTDGSAERIATGTTHSCAVQAGTRAVFCWGDDSSGQATPPDEVNGVDDTALRVAAGDGFSCAVRIAGRSVICWGANGFGKGTAPDEVNGDPGRATDVAVGLDHACALQRITRIAICWGNDSFGQATPPDGVNGTSGTAIRIAVGARHSCARQRTSNAILCWGSDAHGQATPPDSVNGTTGSGSEVASGESHSCALQNGSGNVVCWGNDADGQASPPDSVNGTTGTASAIAAGSNFSCAVQGTSGNTICWGGDGGGQATPPPTVNGTSGTATAAAAGRAVPATTMLTASDPNVGDLFGSSVAIDDDVIVVGAEGADASGFGSGAAYIFQLDTGNWQQDRKLAAREGGPGRRFGRSVAVDADVSVIGADDALNAESSAGSAFAFGP